MPEDDGLFIIHFGGDKSAVNYMDIFEAGILRCVSMNPPIALSESYRGEEEVLCDLTFTPQPHQVPRRFHSARFKINTHTFQTQLLGSSEYGPGAFPRSGIQGKSPPD